MSLLKQRSADYTPVKNAQEQIIHLNKRDDQRGILFNTQDRHRQTTRMQTQENGKGGWMHSKEFHKENQSQIAATIN